MWNQELFVLTVQIPHSLFLTMDNDNIIAVKSKAFAIRTVNLYKYLLHTKKEFILSKQFVRSGTSIGANVKEAIQGQSKKDFLSKLQVSLKEASETEYWLDLLVSSDYITGEQYESINADCAELLKLLTAIITTTKKSLNIYP